MKAHGYLLILVTALCCSQVATAQDEDEYSDSLQKAILQSVQQQLGGNGAASQYLDSTKLLRIALPDLKQIFKDVKEQIQEAKSAGDIDGLGKAYRKLSTVDSMNGNYKSAYENYKLYSIYQDSLRRKEIEKKELQAKLQRDFDRKQAAQQLEKEKEARKNSTRQLFMLAFVLVLVTVAASYFIAYKREQKAKTLLNVQNQEIETTLAELKDTQAQLIHSEKMASLGELTAGIAHEIQNPLNFVNNFSESNTELVEELESAIDKNDASELKSIASDIRENSEKINHHGRRADAIVKSMLQHSRKNSGEKTPTNINALADEYLRLSYHGMRAKDHLFTAAVQSNFDSRIGNVAVVPHDLGRVLLNLFNNAFYSVSEKKKKAGDGYEPVISVRTKNEGDAVSVIVRDNGLGISPAAREKIFQPFFTTKPTGEGTGLGLSLSYDIVTKGHGGSLLLDTKEGEFAEFTVRLPARQPA